MAANRTYADYLNNSDLLRYNSYTGILNAGVIQVRKVIRHFRISKQRVLADYLLARTCSYSKEKGSSREAVALPLVVRKNYSLLMAVRILAFLDSDGYPLVIPTLSLQPSGKSMLVCAPGMFGDMLDAGFWFPRGSLAAYFRCGLFPGQRSLAGESEIF